MENVVREKPGDLCGLKSRENGWWGRDDIIDWTVQDDLALRVALAIWQWINLELQTNLIGDLLVFQIDRPCMGLDSQLWNRDSDEAIIDWAFRIEHLGITDGHYMSRARPFNRVSDSPRDLCV
jgi:hypothetical protein